MSAGRTCMGRCFWGVGGDGHGAGGRVEAEAPWHGGGVLGGEPGRRG